MGCWGDKLYQNDMAQDLKEEYRTYLKLEYSDLEVENMMLDSFEDYIEDGWDKEFWLVLADQEYKLGRLSKKVKRKAMSYLKNPKTKELINLKERLNAEPLPRKKMGKFHMSRSLWKVGDILIYKIRGESLVDRNKNSKYIGSYILFQVTALCRNNIGYLPRDKFYNEDSIVTLYDWVGNEIPSKEEISKMKFKKRKNLEARTLANYVPDTIENGIIKWKRLDFDTVEYTLSFSKRETKKIGIAKLVTTDNTEERIVSDVGRPWINSHNIDNSIIDEFS